MKAREGFLGEGAGERDMEVAGVGRGGVGFFT